MLKSLHHANLLVASSEDAESYFRSICKDRGIELTNNPDFFFFEMETFGIDEARKLSLLAVRKAITGAKAGQAGEKIFLITPTRITTEAQNALLKTFEDPFINTYFFLAVREEGLIIPTLRSRMQSIRISEKLTASSGAAEKFLTLSIKDRLIFAKKFVDEGKNIVIFLDKLLLLLKKKKDAEALVKSVYNIRRLIYNYTLSPRMIIEHLALVL